MDLALFVFAMVSATQLSRLAPMVLSKAPPAAEFDRWLGHVPIAILAALVIPEFAQIQNGSIEWNRLFVVAAFICIAIGAWTKSLLITTAVGIGLVAIARAYL